jgi:hypothetical protein
VTVQDETGATVLTGTGDDGGCCTCTELVTTTVTRGGFLLPFSLKLQTAAGAPLPDGRYGVSAVLQTTDPAPLRPAGQSRIEIRSVY